MNRPRGASGANDANDEWAWPKICSCGAAYSPSTWRELVYIGRSLDKAAPLELRNCRCGSTISVPCGALTGSTRTRPT